MAVRKRFPSASVKEHEIKFASFNRFQHVVSLFFRLKFVNKVIAIRTNFLQRKSQWRLVLELVSGSSILRRAQ